MAALKNEVKSFIVQALACFDTPSQVALAVREEFGIEVTRMQCESHDPTKRAGRDVAKRWQTLFHDTRKRFREETAEIPIANRAFRLRALGRIVEKAETMRNLPLALQVLEQAAKEAGDMYVNRQRKADVDEEVIIPTRIQVDVVDARKPNAEP
ncbi:MAG: Phage protein [Pseudomonas sp.]|nr:Phage protein [Pseudomonas sp.]